MSLRRSTSPTRDWELLQLSGGVGTREPRRRRAGCGPGRQSVGSDHGSSGHQHNPFIALRRATTTEADGEAIGFSLVYSGNFLAEVEVGAFDTTRVRLGISPNTFTWTLEPGARLRDPGGRHRRTRTPGSAR